LLFAAEMVLIRSIHSTKVVVEDSLEPKMVIIR
jgi:hypothetical protein